MKRIIRASKSWQINQTDFVDKVVAALKQFLPKNCWPKPSIRREYITLDSVPSKQKIYTAFIEAVEALGYFCFEVPDSEGYDLAVVDDNDAFATVSFNLDPSRKGYDYPGFIFINCDNGNALFEDWYDEYQVDLLRGKKPINSSVGTGKRIRYILIDYPDREPIRNIDTGARYSFDSREEAEQFIEDNPYFKKKYPGIRVDSRQEYSVWHK